MTLRSISMSCGSMCKNLFTTSWPITCWGSAGQSNNSSLSPFLSTKTIMPLNTFTSNPSLKTNSVSQLHCTAVQPSNKWTSKTSKKAITLNCLGLSQLPETKNTQKKTSSTKPKTTFLVLPSNPEKYPMTWNSSTTDSSSWPNTI